MFEDIRAVFDRDPAAANIFEVLLYPGVHAIYLHRLAHFLHRFHIPVIPRLINFVARLLTGIDIHPGATIGPGFFIDHGAGVVIGETTVIGEGVTIYQGVTLGGTGRQHGKRHPTIGNHVVIGAGAIVLGAITIGDNARVGAAAVVTKPVPPDTTVVGNPARVVYKEGRKVVEEPLAHGELPDPVGKALEEMQSKIRELEERVRKLS